MSFAERLRISRKEKGYSQETLAEELNVSRQTVTKWETENAYPEIKTLLLLSVLLEKALDWLFSDDLLAVRASNSHSMLGQERERERDMNGQGSSNRISRAAVDTALEELQTPAMQTVTGSGYGFIDDGRGWVNQVYILYGVPAIGKTAFALNIIDNVIRAEGHAAYFNLLRPAKHAIRKLLGISAQVSTYPDREYGRIEKKRLLKEPAEEARRLLQPAVMGKDIMNEIEAADPIDGEVWLLQREDYYRLPEEHDHLVTLTIKPRFTKNKSLITGKLHFDPETLKMTEIRRT